MDNFKINSSSINHIQNHDLDFIKAMNGIFAVLDGISRASSCRIVAKKLVLLTNDKYHELKSAIGAMEKLGPQAQKVFIAELSTKLQLKKADDSDVLSNELKDIAGIKKALKEHLKYQINVTADIQAKLAIDNVKTQYGKINDVVNVLVDEFKQVEDQLGTQPILKSLGNLEATLSAAAEFLGDLSKGSEVHAMAIQKADNQQTQPDMQQKISALEAAIVQEKQKINQAIAAQDQLKPKLTSELEASTKEAALAKDTLSQHRAVLNTQISDKADLNRELSRLDKLAESATKKQNITSKKEELRQLESEMERLSNILRQAQTTVAKKETAVAKKSSELKEATKRRALLETQLHKIDSIQLNRLQTNDSIQNVKDNLTTVKNMRKAAHTLDEVERVLAVNGYQTVQDLALDVHASLPIFSIEDPDKQQQILSDINQQLELDRSANQVDSVRMNAAEKVVDDVFSELQNRLKSEELQPVKTDQIEVVKEEISQAAADKQAQIKDQLIGLIKQYTTAMANVSDLEGVKSCEDSHKEAIQNAIGDPEGPTDATLQQIAAALRGDTSDESIKQLKLEDILSELSESATKQTFDKFIGDIASNCTEQINDANRLVNEIQQMIEDVETLKEAAKTGEPKATESLTTMSNDISHIMEQFIGRLNNRVISSGSQSFF